MCDVCLMMVTDIGSPNATPHHGKYFINIELIFQGSGVCVMLGERMVTHIGWSNATLRHG